MRLLGYPAIYLYGYSITWLFNYVAIQLSVYSVM